MIKLGSVRVQYKNRLICARYMTSVHQDVTETSFAQLDVFIFRSIRNIMQ